MDTVINHILENNDPMNGNLNFWGALVILTIAIWILQQLPKTIAAWFEPFKAYLELSRLQQDIKQSKNQTLVSHYSSSTDESKQMKLTIKLNEEILEKGTNSDIIYILKLYYVTKLRALVNNINWLMKFIFLYIFIHFISTFLINVFSFIIISATLRFLTHSLGFYKETHDFVNIVCIVIFLVLSVRDMLVLKNLLLSSMNLMNTTADEVVGYAEQFEQEHILSLDDYTTAILNRCQTAVSDSFKPRISFVNPFISLTMYISYKIHYNLFTTILGNVQRSTV